MAEGSHNSFSMRGMINHMPTTTTSTGSLAAPTDQPSGSALMASSPRAETIPRSVLSPHPLSIHDTLQSNSQVMPTATTTKRSQKKGRSTNVQDKFWEEALCENEDWTERKNNKAREIPNKQDKSTNPRRRPRSESEDYDQAMPQAKKRQGGMFEPKDSEGNSNSIDVANMGKEDDDHEDRSPR